MKAIDINTLCIDELSLQEAQSTNGGSLTVLLVCAAAALLLSSCGNTFSPEFNKPSVSITVHVDGQEYHN